MNLNKRIQAFIKLEASGGIVLFCVLILVLLVANSNLYPSYQQLIEVPIQIRIGQLNIEKPAILWVNELLMAIFFMLLALEIKREMLEGELSSPSQLSLPFIGAVGGIGAPALIYIALNHGGGDATLGWPIPTTTDIAFTLGIVSLMSKRVPLSLKVFVIALSIVDDILAIGIISIFYTGTLSLTALKLATYCVVAWILLNQFGVKRITPYMLIGLAIWVCVLESKIHATIAGVAIGLLIPLYSKSGSSYSPLRRLELMLHPWVAFLILPIFVIFNGGISFREFSFETFFSSVPLGIALGLFLGKSLGVFSIVWLAIKLNCASMPAGSNWRQLFAVASLTGIGFTMSLFLSALAFNETPYENLARQGVLIGSLLSLLLGVGMLYLGQPHVNNNNNQK